MVTYLDDIRAVVLVATQAWSLQNEEDFSDAVLDAAAVVEAIAILDVASSLTLLRICEFALYANQDPEFQLLLFLVLSLI